MAIELKPMFDRIVIEPINEPVKETGIILPETTRKKILKATVVAVGGGYAMGNGWIDITSRVGDTVLYPDYASTLEYTENNIKYLIISEKDIIGLIR